MSQSLLKSMRDSSMRALQNFWKQHIVDYDPYDAFEVEQSEIRMRECDKAKDDYYAGETVAVYGGESLSRAA